MRPKPGVEPDPRFSFANERTFLAWIRTALALIAGGLAATELLPPFEDVSGGRVILGLPLLALGGAIAVIAYVRWTRNEQAMRLGQPLPSSRLLLVVAVAVCAVAGVAAVLVVLG